MAFSSAFAVNTFTLLYFSCWPDACKTRSRQRRTAHTFTDFMDNRLVWFICVQPAFRHTDSLQPHSAPYTHLPAVAATAASAYSYPSQVYKALHTRFCHSHQ